MSPLGPDSELALEQATIALFEELGYDWANLYQEQFGTDASHGRETSREVVFCPRLQAAIENLNPDLPSEAHLPAHICRPAFAAPVYGGESLGSKAEYDQRNCQGAGEVFHGSYQHSHNGD